MIINNKLVFLFLACFGEAAKSPELQLHGYPKLDLRKVPNTVQYPPNTTVDFYSMPSCAASYCTNTTQGTFNAFSCPEVSGTCPAKRSADNSCTTYTLDCWCNLTTPLSCAWKCAWFPWLEAEDWFQQTCPSVKPVNFSKLPACASQCVTDESFNYGCITANRNCFCLHGSMFGCTSNCNDNDINNINAWYANECNVTQSDAASIVNGTKSDARTSSGPAIPPQGIRWYEICAVVVMAISIGLWFGGLLVSPWLRRKISDINQENKQRLE